MPFVTWSEANSGATLLPNAMPEPSPEAPKEPASAVDVAAAGLRASGNIVTALYDAGWEPDLPARDPNYDFSKDIAGYEKFAKDFIRSGSAAETQRIKDRIDQELAAARTVDQAGAWGVASAVAGGFLDPVTLLSMAIPVAPELAGASRAARIRAGIGATAALDIGEEAAIHKLRETRGVGDSLLRVGAGALLTGAFGALATRVPKTEFERMVNDLNDTMKEVPDQQSVGAMRAGDNLTLDDLTINTKVGRFLAQTVGRISLIDRVMTASSKKARILALEVAEFPAKLNMNFKGIATPTSIETRAVQREMSQRYAINQALNEAYMKYRARVETDPISFRQFKIEASKAARRGDVHAIPEVSEVAKTGRKLVLDPDKAELQKFGVLPDEIDLLGAKSYFPRLYDHDYIRAHGTKFRNVLRRHFAGNPPDEVLPDGTVKPSAKLDDAELKALVEEVVTHVMGTTRGIADIATITIPGMLKKRVLNIPEDKLEEFLVNDYEHVMGGYIRAMAPQIETRRAGFQKMSFEDELQEVHDEYDALRTNAKSDKAIAALDKEEEAVLRDLKGMILRTTNQIGPKGSQDYKGLIKAGRLLRGYNYSTKLGGQTLSSFSDFGHIATRYGLVKTNKALSKFLTNIDFNKMTRTDAKRMGVAVDWVLDSRASTLGDIGDELGSSKIERGVEWATKNFTRVTGMATWNSVMKSLVSALEQDAIVRGIQKGADLPAFQKAKLAEYGMGEDELKRVAKMVEKHADDSEGMWRMRTDEWEDKGAAQLVESAISKAANIMVIRKGAGDLPLMMNSEAVKTVMQFKSFGMAAVNRILIPVAQGLSHADAASANGFALMLALGGLTYASKEYAAGRKPDLSPGQVAKEALNWSGVLGYLPDVWDPLTGLAPKSVRQDLRFSKFKDVSAMQTLLGPSFGTGSDTYSLLSGLADGEGVSQRDLHNVRKAFVPMQNVFYLRRIIDALEGEMGEAIGAEGANSQQFMERVTKTEEPKK